MSDELVEVIAEAWELPYEVRTALTHNWSAEGVQILKGRFTRDILAALRSTGFQVFQTKKTTTTYLSGHDAHDRGLEPGAYFLVPVEGSGV